MMNLFPNVPPKPERELSEQSVRGEGEEGLGAISLFPLKFLRKDDQTRRSSRISGEIRTLLAGIWGPMDAS